MSEIAGLQEVWDLLTCNVSPFYLRTFGTFILHELFYWGSYVPFFVADQVPSMKKYKIQLDKSSEMPPLRDCFANVMANHFLVVLPMVLISHFFEFLGVGADHDIPSLWTILIQVFICFVIEDFFFYWGHRLLHTEWLYKHIHAIHHQYSAPIGIAAEYAHPFEVVILGVSTIFGPMICRPHLVTLWVYLFCRCFQTVECHSGYDFPWSINNWLPFYGGADFHDHHHKHYSGNYASVFVWNDWLYGTDDAYRHWKSKQIQQMQSSSSHKESLASDDAVLKKTE